MWPAADVFSFGPAGRARWVQKNVTSRNRNVMLFRTGRRRPTSPARGVSATRPIHLSCLLSSVSCLLSSVSCLLSPVSCLLPTTSFPGPAAPLQDPKDRRRPFSIAPPPRGSAKSAKSADLNGQGRRHRPRTEHPAAAPVFSLHTVCPPSRARQWKSQRSFTAGGRAVPAANHDHANHWL